MAKLLIHTISHTFCKNQNYDYDFGGDEGLYEKATPMLRELHTLQFFKLVAMILQASYEDTNLYACRLMESYLSMKLAYSINIKLKCCIKSH